jgi:hypothetical protein
LADHGKDRQVPKVIIDVTDVPESQFQPYDGPIPPKGLYKAVWKRGWWTKSSTGKPMLKLLFVLETDHKDKKQFNGYPVFHNITYEASTMWKMKELFTALNAGNKAGIDYDDSNGNVNAIGRAKVGKSFLLIHGQTETYQGNVRLGVSVLSPLPRPEGEEDEVFDDEDADAEATPFDQAGGVVVADEDTSGDAFIAPDAGNDDSADEPPF